MKRSGRITLTFASILIATSLNSQTPAAASPNQPALGVVTVNFNAAVLGTAEAQRDLLALQKKFAPRERQLQKMNDEFEASKKQLSDPVAAKLSDSDRSAKMLELGDRDKQLQREAEDYKNDSQSETQQIFQRIAQKVFTFLQDFSQQHGYSAVLERGTDTAPIVWYAASNVDITEQLVKSYNIKSGIPDPGLPDGPSQTQHQGSTTPK